MPTQTINDDTTVLSATPSQAIDSDTLLVHKFIDLVATVDLVKSEEEDFVGETEVTQTTPVAPTLLTATDLLLGDVVRLVWSGGGPFYNVYFKKTADVTFIKVNGTVLPGSQTQYDVGGLVRDTSYDFQVSSINGEGTETF